MSWRKLATREVAPPGSYGDGPVYVRITKAQAGKAWLRPGYELKVGAPPLLLGRATLCDHNVVRALQSPKVRRRPRHHMQADVAYVGAA